MNIQATRDFVMYLRGELLGQPYLVLIDKPDTRADSRVSFRLLTYNIRHGGPAVRRRSPK